MVPGSKKSPGLHRQPGEAISQQLWPRYWQRPGSSALRIWLSRINRHHSDRLAGPLTPFRRRDKPGSRCPVIQFECIIAQDMTYCNGETSVIRPDLTSPGAYILFLGESLISQPSGEVHTPVWSQAFMGPVGHSDPLYEGSPMEDAALRNLRLENLRSATLALQNGVDVKTVSSMLEHYDAGFTLRTYTHATRQKQDEAGQTMGSFMAQVM